MVVWKGRSAYLITFIFLMSLVTSGLGPSLSVVAQDHDGTVTRTKEGESSLTFTWAEEDQGKVQELNLSLNKGWEIKQAFLKIKGSPLITDELQEVYPENPILTVGLINSVWTYPGEVGHQTKFADDKDTIELRFSKETMRDLYIGVPANSTIQDLRFYVNNSQSGQYEYEMFVEGSSDPVWKRSSIGYTKGFVLPTSYPLDDVCVDHLDSLFDSYVDLVGVGENGSLFVAKNADAQLQEYDLETIMLGDGPGLLACYIGDYDQDLSNDIVTTSSDGKVYVLENKGFGQFQRPQTISPATNRIESVKFGDLNNDGWQDVIAGYLNGDIFVSNFNNTNGSFDDPVKLKAGNGAIKEVFIGDMDLDALNDIIVASSDGNWWFFKNDKGTGWEDAVPTRSGGPDLTSMTVADLNWDNSIDLISGSIDGSFYVSYNAGGSFDDGVVLSGGGGSMREVVSGDLDLDGDIDILGLNADGWIYLIKNEFSFLEDPVKLIEVGKGVRSMDLGDVDNDNDLDIILGREKGFEIYGNQLGPFKELVGTNDGGRLVGAVQKWLDNHPSSEEFYDQYGNVFVKVHLKVTSTYPGSLRLEDLDIKFETRHEIQFANALNAYIKANEQKADPMGNLDVPVEFRINGMGILDLEQLFIGYKEHFIAIIDEPTNHQVLYNTTKLKLGCHSSFDPLRDTDDFDFIWTVDGRSLGAGSELVIRGRDLGGIGNHSVKCRVVLKKTQEVSEASIFIDLSPNAAPIIQPQDAPEKAKVNKKVQIEIQGKDDDP